MNKLCKKCGIEKPVGEFYVRKDNGKLLNECKACQLNQSSKYRAIPKNQKRKSERAAELYAIPENRKLALERAANRYAIPEKRKQLLEQAAARALIPKNKKRRSERQAERLRTDLQFKIAKNLRGRSYSALKNKPKSSSAVSDLGCTIDEFISHIESQFQPGMTWDNWSRTGWHIDHIKPLYLLTKDPNNRALYLELAHYTNQRPLWAKDNLTKSCKVSL